jgi:hypothetical protein
MSSSTNDTLKMLKQRYMIQFHDKEDIHTNEIPSRIQNVYGKEMMKKTNRYV